MDYNRLADLCLPNIDKTPDYWEAKFAPRQLPKGAQVTRLAPSPTGFIHLGNLYGALADERIAHQSKGTFYLRIEDTDAKREVEGAVDIIINVLRYFDIEFDEGAGIDNPEINKYGPYFQRQRAEIYQTYVKDLIRRGLAYPCFCTEEELNAIKEEQMKHDILTGYHTKWAKCRNLTCEEVEENIKAGKPFVMRLRSQGVEGKEVTFTDTIKGEISFPENIQDVIILKSDGIPTYHFAHAIDDHLMGTTLVIRGEEWLSSVPTHLELFDVLGFKRPAYAHTAHLMKMEDGSKRKLSKRKDPELSLDFYRQDGYHPHCVKVYLMTLLNSNFEEWYDKHPDSPIEEFKFDVHKMAQSGALFDMDKLHNICRNEFAKMDTDTIYDFLYQWNCEYNKDMVDVYFKSPEYFKKALELFMGVGQKRRRKDFEYAKQIMPMFSFFFDETFVPSYEFKYDNAQVREVLEKYLASYDHSADNNGWFNNVKAIADECGFASDMKAYKANPENYKGSVSDIAEILRITITGAPNSPDLWTILQIMGEDKMRERIGRMLEKLR
ncbi:MAG: glutamate--tRNA ligase [Lachnospiraceae bacterium]